MTTRFTDICCAAYFLCTNANAESVRYYLGYGDQRTVDYARNSGSDPLAAIGKEMPPGVAVRVPSLEINGGIFRVQYWREYTSGTAPWLRDGVGGFNIAYDRSLAADGSWNPPLDESSFRKLTYAYDNRADCFSNPGSFPGWKQNGDIFDANNDGIQDIATISQSGVRTYGTFGPGASVRPIGLGGVTTAIAYGFGASIHAVLGERQRLFDVDFRTLMNSGEMYGFAEGETGISLLCTSNPDGASSNFFYPSAGITFTGAKYKLLAVPEPSGLFALGIAWLFYRRCKQDRVC